MGSRIRQADGSRLEEGKITLSEKVLISKGKLIERWEGAGTNGK